MYRILVINPGSTSTKSAIFEDRKCIAEQSIAHSTETLTQNPLTWQQVELRKEGIINWMKDVGFNLKDIDAFAVRGCNIKGCSKGGTYLVNETIKNEIFSQHNPDKIAPHASRLSLPIALSMSESEKVDIPIFITDPPCVNELSNIAKISGHPLFTRESVFHALNSKVVAHRVAEEWGKKYQEGKFIVAHMGGGISVGAHNMGQVTEVNDCIAGGGAFSPNRTGTLPVVPLVELCFSNSFTKNEIIRIIKNKGGVLAHLGTDDMREVEKRIDSGDTHAELIFNAMAYQVAKEIGSCYAALCCDVDAIIFTGGMANSKRLIGEIRRYVEKMGNIKVVPGEYEAEALAFGTLRVLTKEEEPIIL
ncbi:butyrate kinase [Sedimentibacter sp.]|uniref:butyrate kinase n=1 Tax=Sedimentibacter sp. TaxID=1960295 RepID=UPI00289DCB98|nr:butyrate kinase [Sedimentibacter sp.]